MTCIGILGISVTEKGGGTSCFGEVSNALGDKWAFSCHISIQLGRGVLIKLNWGQNTSVFFQLHHHVCSKVIQNVSLTEKVGFTLDLVKLRCFPLDRSSSHFTQLTQNSE